MESNTASPGSSQPQSPYPPVVPGDQFYANPPPMLPPMIDGLVVQGSKFAIGGGSKSHKTWLLIDLALSVSTGSPWFEFPTHATRVLYANFEIPAYFFHERLKLIAQAKGIAVPSELLVWNLRGVKIEKAEDLQLHILYTTGAQKAGLVLLDPIYKYGGGIDENSTAEIIKLFGSIDVITGKTGAGVCYGAHFSKGNQAGKNAIDRVSGSGVHARDPDAIINLTTHKEKDAYTVDVILRFMPPVASFVVRWECPLFVIDRALDPADLQKKPGPGGRKKKAVVADLLNVLAAHRKFIDTNAFYVPFKDIISRRTFNALVVELRALPGVTQLMDGQWVYTL